MLKIQNNYLYIIKINIKNNKIELHNCKLLFYIKYKCKLWSLHLEERINQR